MCESEQKRHIAPRKWQATVIEGLSLRVLPGRRRCVNGQKGTRACGERGYGQALVSETRG